MKFLVKEVVEFSKIIEADTKEEALEAFGNKDADTRQIKITATPLRRNNQSPTDRLAKGKEHGIVVNINRANGHLENCFVPRYSKHSI